MSKLGELFCDVDDFCKVFIPLSYLSYKDTQNNKVPNHSIINKHKVLNLFSFLGFKIRNSRLFRIARDERS
jgi:hypothetical protein